MWVWMGFIVTICGWCLGKVIYLWTRGTHIYLYSSYSGKHSWSFLKLAKSQVLKPMLSKFGGFFLVPIFNLQDPHNFTPSYCTDFFIDLSQPLQNFLHITAWKTFLQYCYGHVVSAQNITKTPHYTRTILNYFFGVQKKSLAVTTFHLQKYYFSAISWYLWI